MIDSTDRTISNNERFTIMKKRMMVLAIMGMFLACAQAVLAASWTSVLMDSWGYLSTAEDGIHAQAHGNVTFTTPKRGGGADLTVKLSNAAKSYSYLLISNGTLLGTFTTDKHGNGSLQVHVTDVSTLGPWVCVWTSDRAVNLMCARDPFWTGN